MRVRIALVGAVVAACAVACAPLSVTTPPSPSSVPSGGEAWSVVNLSQPSAVTDAPSLQPGYHCSPCHPAAASQLAAAARTGIGTIAVGVQQPPARAIALLSSDGRGWQDLTGFDAAVGTSANAVASLPARTVIVGQDASGATSWASTGNQWTAATEQSALRVPYAAGAMTSVTSFGDGFVAGGYRDDPSQASNSGAIWRSIDGLTWQLDDPSTFKDGRVWGVAATKDVLVAVGTTKDPNYGPAAAWWWTATAGWQRARIAPGDAGAMRAVVAAPNGFVAVGLDGHDDGALAWTSRDGQVWTAVADAPSLHYYSSPIRMQSVVVAGSGFLAGGWRSDAGNGSAVAWTSPDGVTWTQMPWQPSFSGGEMTGVAAVDDRLIAVGRTGYPDNNQATIWVGSTP